MNDLIIHGVLHAPYFIFLRCAGRCSDAELLDRFNLSTYRLTQDAARLRRHTILAEDGQWTLIADDWYYTLWHMPSTRPAIEVLAERFDVFACSVGDCDHSFDFVYYCNEHLVRRHVVADPDFRGGVVVEDFGEPLPGEAAAFQESDELRIVLGIATSLGIKTGYTEADLRVYAPGEAEGAKGQNRTS